MSFGHYERRPVADRFWDRVFPEPNSGCWLWMGARSGGGYGIIEDNCQRIYAHRLSYELHYGAVPTGMYLDHLCRVRCCVNPDHLEPVTKRENTLRGISPTAVNFNKARCIRGHLLAGENLRVWADGHRHCRQCHVEINRARRRQLIAGHVGD